MMLKHSTLLRSMMDLCFQGTERMMAKIQKIIQHPVCPSDFSLLPQTGTEFGLTGVRYNSKVATMRATIEVEAKGSNTAGSDLFHRLKYHRPNPPFVLLNKGLKMEARYL